MEMQQQGRYGELVEKEADAEEGAEEDPPPQQGGDGQEAAQMVVCCGCCCCFFFIWLFCGIGAMIFAPPEPRAAPGDQIWEPVLPANFTTCVPSATMWFHQDVHAAGIPCEGVSLGSWQQGWGFFSWYFYYVQNDETVIYAQSAWRLFGDEFRIWRGDNADGPRISLIQDYWAQPWFATEKVRIFDVYEESIHIARMTETVTGAWVGYGGATVDTFPTQRGEEAGERPGMLVRMTQPGCFWLLYFEPPAWEIQNFAPQDLPSAIPSFYSLYSDIMEQEQATGPLFWCLIICLVCMDNRPRGASRA